MTGWLELVQEKLSLCTYIALLQKKREKDTLFTSNVKKRVTKLRKQVTFFNELWFSCSDLKKLRNSFYCKIFLCGFPLHTSLFQFPFKWQQTSWIFQNLFSSLMIKYLLTKLGQARWENILLSFMKYGSCYIWSVCHNHEPNIFPSSPPTQSISTYYVLSIWMCMLELARCQENQVRYYVG